MLRSLSIALTLVAMLVLTPASVSAIEFTEGEYGVCVTGPDDRFDDAMVGYTNDAVVGNGHWHFEGGIPSPGCYVGTFFTVVDDRGTHSYTNNYWLVDQDTALRLVTYNFGYCSGDDQFCGKNNRNSRGSNSQQD